MTTIVKKQGIREHTEGFNVGSGVYEAVDRKVQELLSEAVERAEQNGRRTVKARDV